MLFRIANTFQESLARLTADEQTAAKVTVYELQANPAHPSIQFHRVGKGKDKSFWSGRVSQDLRLIIHKRQDSLLLCYVGHHDDAYRWAERRKIDVHAVTGAAQIVEVREVIREVVRTVHTEAERPPPLPHEATSTTPLFGSLKDEELLGYGVPEDWLNEVRAVTESELYELIDHLPVEAAEALFALATGEVPEVASAGASADPFEHPAAKARFVTIADEAELEAALESPWEQWAIFLHPTQRDLVSSTFNGPARVSGSAGTGKTVVALHRAVDLADRDPNARVLLSTFSPELAEHLKVRLRRLLSSKPRLGERIDVEALDALALRLYRFEFRVQPTIASPDHIRGLLRKYADEAGVRHSESFVVSEWEQIVDAWQIRTWEAYKSVPRLGRKVRLPEAARVHLWSVFEKVQSELASAGLRTHAEVYDALAEAYAQRDGAAYQHVVLDEAQDASATQLRFLANLVGDRTNGLFFTGDLGQRIFQQPFSWLSVGVDIRGRSRTLKVNYRTSQQIRERADRLLDPRTEDVDGEHQDRKGTLSVFSGPEPVIRLYPDEAAENAAVAAWLRSHLDAGFRPEEIGVFVRAEEQLARAKQAVGAAGLKSDTSEGAFQPAPGHVAVISMHGAKGLEFRAVAVMACDEDVLPLASRERAAADMVELAEVNETERHLLYVAITRAREELFISGVTPGSVFLQDL